jgi:hypothetical protein
MLAVPLLRRLRQEDHELRSTWAKLKRSVSKTEKKKKARKEPDVLNNIITI